MVVMNNANTTERLIQEVRSRQPLWDQRNINYHNRVVVNSLWQDIADLLQVNKETVKVKWKGLRDTYRRELKKQRSSATVQSSSSENPRDPSWTHYSSMNFLREYMGSNNNQNDLFHFQGWSTDDLVADGETTSPSVSNANDSFNSFTPAAISSEAIETTKQAGVMATESSPTNSLTDDEWTRGGLESKNDPHHQQSTVHSDKVARESPSSPPLLQNTRSSLQKKRSVPRISRLKEHRGRLRPLNNKLTTKRWHHSNSISHMNRNGLPPPQPANEDSDDDLYFFKSLVPYVKSLPPTRKLYLRSEIHNLVLREMMAVDVTVTNGSHHPHGVIPLEHVSVGFNA